jgi:predicted dehydrogenase
VTRATRARVGLVGAGWWSGRTHLPALAANPDAELVAVCDPDADRARAAASLFGVPHPVTTVEEMLQLDLDCVLVATPHDAHHAPAAAALDAGVDVMVEKPMTLDPAQAWDLVRRARDNGARLHVGYPFPHSPHAAAVRELIARGDIGEPVLVAALFATSVVRLYRGDVEAVAEEGGAFAPRASTYAERAHGGGQLQTQMTHAASLVLWTTGLRPREVSAYAQDRGLDVDVADALAVSMDGGAIATLATTGTVDDHEQRVEEYRIFGSEGHVLLDTVRGTLRVLRRGHQPVDHPSLSEHDAQPSDATSAALVAAALGKGPVLVPGEIGAMTVDLLHAAAQSARTGVPVTARPADASVEAAGGR